MAVNKNSMLRWTGGFTPVIASVVAGNDGPVAFPQDADFATVYPLVNDTSNAGTIDPYTFIVTALSHPAPAPEWDPVNAQLKVFRPYSNPGGTFTVKYRISDGAGHQSNEATITFNMLAAATAWIGYAPSYTCLLDTFGNQTGYALYNQLILVYTPSNTPVTPQSLKPNVTSDPDYIGPVHDVITCVPANLPVTPLNITNFANSNPAGFIIITGVRLLKTSPAVNIFYAMSLPPGSSQQLMVPSDIYDDVQISYTVVGSVNAAGYHWFYQSGAGSPASIGNIINTPPFSYGTTNIPYPVATTLYAQ